MTACVPIHGGTITLVDDDTAEAMAGFRWSLSGRRYVRTSPGVLLHRLVVGAAPGEHVDHINGDKLDNRRENLRIATAAENSRNARKRTAGASAFKGVDWRPRKRRWRARIVIDGRERSLGLHASELDAARAYDRAARAAFGAFACVNFPRPGEQGARP